MGKWKFILAVTLIIALAISLRIYSFVFPHDHGDQIIYAALAQNIADSKPYNIWSTKIVKTNLLNLNFLSYKHCKNPNLSIGNAFKNGGINIYEKKLFYRPPLFPFLIQSTKYVDCNQHIFSFELSIMRHSKRPDIFFKSWIKKQPFENLLFIAKKQLPIALPPFLSSLLILTGIIYLSNFLFDKYIALWAGFIAAFSPVDIFCASRVLPDSLLTAFILWLLIFIIISFKNKNKFFLIPAFLFTALAIAVKETSVPIITGALLIGSYKNKNKRLLLTLIVFAFLCIGVWCLILKINNGCWLPAAWKFNLNIANLNWFKNNNTNASTALWYKLTTQRSKFFHFYTPFTLYPILLFSLFYYIDIFKKEKVCQNFIMIVPLITLIIITLLQAKEFRQIMPAYPFLIIASACGLEKLRKKINVNFQPIAGFVIILFIIIAVGIYAFSKIAPSLFGNAGDIFI